MNTRKSTIENNPRVLTKAQAARYCGVCTRTFAKVYPIPPRSMSGRIYQYDIRDIDAWIDSLGRHSNAEWEQKRAES